MQITRLKPQELTRHQLDAWSALQSADPAFDSPFFRPEFTTLVAQLRPEVEVAVLDDGNGSLGFWPYHRDPRGIARPVGLALSDLQGVVARPDLPWSPNEMLRQCGLTGWIFDHQLASQVPLASHHWSCAAAPFIDLRFGFDLTRRERAADGTQTITQTLRKMRKISREIGPLRLVPDCRDERVLETVIDWKRQQYRRLRSTDYLAADWTRELLRRVAATQESEFSGMLTALYAGDHLLAAHLGLRSRHVLHCWFPTYNRQFKSYSPGLALWLTLAQEAAGAGAGAGGGGGLGIERIDLGKGDERYKHSLKTGDRLVAEGAVDLSPVRGALRHGWWRARRLIQNSPAAVPIRSVVGSLRAVRYGWLGPVAETPSSSGTVPADAIRVEIGGARNEKMSATSKSNEPVVALK